MTQAVATEDRVPPRPAFSFTDDERELILSVRRQSDAKAAAELLLGCDIRPKQIRGRCCLFVGLAKVTSYTGYTWSGAIARLIYLRKKETAQGRELSEAIASTATKPVDTDGGSL